MEVWKCREKTETVKTPDSNEKFAIAKTPGITKRQTEEYSWWSGGIVCMNCLQIVGNQTSEHSCRDGKKHIAGQATMRT